ncbi:MAG: hypothetical protein IIB63_10360 [Proteobacteria bacterium]|nr:hypothetical protein [Pseudomonadota bacterium]
MRKLHALSIALAILAMVVLAGVSPVTAGPVTTDGAGGQSSGGGEDSPDWLVGEEMCARPA